MISDTAFYSRIPPQTAQDAPGDERERFAWLLTCTPDSAPRRSVQRAWTSAVLRHDYRLEEILFDHLWPGVF